jgi:hypothetical protein
LTADHGLQGVDFHFHGLASRPETQAPRNEFKQAFGTRPGRLERAALISNLLRPWSIRITGRLGSPAEFGRELTDLRDDIRPIADTKGSRSRGASNWIFGRDDFGLWDETFLRC